MRIAYEAKRLFSNVTGLGNYARTLVSDLVRLHPEHEYILLTPKVIRNRRTENYFQNERVRIVEPRWVPGALWRQWGMGRAAFRERASLLHGLSNELPMDSGLGKVPSLVTIHDLIFRYFPEQYGRVNAALYDMKFRSACRRADAVVAISQATAEDIVRFYGVPRERIRVIHQGCDPAFSVRRSAEEIATTRARHGIPSEYLLHVGSMIERKNLLRLVQALRLVPDAPPLVVRGEGRAYRDVVLRYIAEHKMEKRVIFTGPIPFADLPALYQGAHAFIYVSVMEGFGIPVIEALSGGTPVITSSVSSMPEAGGPGSLQVDPFRVEAIADAISQLLADSKLHDSLAQQGVKWVERFAADKVTGQMMQLYREVSGRTG